MSDQVLRTSVCPVCSEEFCLTCGFTFAVVPAPHDCKWHDLDALSEQEKVCLPPCFRCLIDMVKP